VLKMDSEIAFVKEQILAQDKMMQKYSDQPNRVHLHGVTKSKFEGLLQTLEALRAASKGPTEIAVPHHGNGNQLAGIHLSLDDIEGIPSELMEELSISESDRQGMVIADIIRGFGGVASLDKIILFVHKRTGVIIKRNTIKSKLFRMVEKKMIFNVPTKRGIYSSYEMTEDEAKTISGTTEQDATTEYRDGPSNEEAEPRNVIKEANAMIRKRRLLDLYKSKPADST
jgi:hypothetical protein